MCTNLHMHSMHDILGVSSYKAKRGLFHPGCCSLSAWRWIQAEPWGKTYSGTTVMSQIKAAGSLGTTSGMSLLSGDYGADSTFRFQQAATHLVNTFIHQASEDVYFIWINIFKD